jgi:cell fate regulator YaaT (PSP1 superfamily)
MELPDGQTAFPYVEVRFKNSRKEYFHNKEELSLKIGDIVATQSKSGHDVGAVTLTGELVRVQLKKKRVRNLEELPVIYRIANQNDVDRWVNAREREEPLKTRARQIAISLQLKMKISDIEFQGDGSKATVYYTAEERVDFRELIRQYASEFKTRIEMRQIGLRQEAARLGGIGSCGRELCCSTWLTDFRSVTTSAARYQNLSLNSQKLAGQCGKLKCCLNYELDSYLDALKDFPKQNQKLYTTKGIAVCQKVDIFKRIMWYCYEGDWMNWHSLSVDEVNKIVAMNKAKETVASIENYAHSPEPMEEANFENVVGQDSLTRFDHLKKKNRGKRRRNKKSASPNRQKQEVKNSAKDSNQPQKKRARNRKRRGGTPGKPNNQGNS